MSASGSRTGYSSNYSLSHQLSARSNESHSTSLLFVVLDSLHYIAGEKVDGEILLNLPSNFPESTLKLVSRGVEKVKIGSSSQTSMIYNLESSVKTWEKMTPAGQYIFPFTFKLPAFAPSTFNYYGQDDQNTEILGEVTYEVLSILEFPSDEDKNMTHSRNINIRNSSSKMSPSINYESTEVLKGLCCGSKGYTLFKVSAHRELHAQTDSIIMFKLETDNSASSSSILKIKSQIRMELELNIESQSSKTFVVFNKNSKDTWIPSSRSSLMLEKELEFESGIFFDEGLNPSSNKTGCIECRYFIEFHIDYDTQLKNPVVIKIPIHIDPKHNFDRENPNIPENWSPRESPVYSALIDESMSKMSSNVISLFID